MSRLDDLRNEVAELEAQAKARQDGAVQQDAQEPAPTSTDLGLKGIFDALLYCDKAEEQKRQEIEDATMHVCASCFLLQRQENATCELCRQSDWLIPSEAKSNPEQEMFIRMAFGHSIEQLKIALHSGWARTPERERVARTLLMARENQLLSQEQVMEEGCRNTAVRPAFGAIDLKKVARYYDLQIAQLQAEQDKLDQLQK